MSRRARLICRSSSRPLRPAREPRPECPGGRARRRDAARTAGSRGLLQLLQIDRRRPLGITARAPADLLGGALRMRPRQPAGPGSPSLPDANRGWPADRPRPERIGHQRRLLHRLSGSISPRFARPARTGSFEELHHLRQPTSWNPGFSRSASPAANLSRDDTPRHARRRAASSAAARQRSGAPSACAGPSLRVARDRRAGRALGPDPGSRRSRTPEARLQRDQSI